MVKLSRLSGIRRRKLWMDKKKMSTNNRRLHSATSLNVFVWRFTVYTPRPTLHPHPDYWTLLFSLVFRWTRGISWLELKLLVWSAKPDKWTCRTGRSCPTYFLSAFSPVFLDFPLCVSGYRTLVPFFALIRVSLDTQSTDSSGCWLAVKHKQAYGPWTAIER